jgi:hypothetical protein
MKCTHLIERKRRGREEEMGGTGREEEMGRTGREEEMGGTGREEEMVRTGREEEMGGTGREEAMGGTVRQGNGGLKREGRKIDVKLSQGNSGSATKEEKNEGRREIFG